MRGNRLADQAGAGGDGALAWVLRADKTLFECCADAGSDIAGIGYDVHNNWSPELYVIGWNGLFARRSRGVCFQVPSAPPLNGARSFAVSQQYLWVVNNAGNVFRCSRAHADG